MSEEKKIDLPEEYRYRFEKYLQFGEWKYTWSIIGEHGGVHLHISTYTMGGKINYSCGLELHFRSPPHYKKNTPPDCDECFLLKSPCWHGGTSLHAHNHYLPMFTNNYPDEYIFNEMVMDARIKFKEFCHDAKPSLSSRIMEVGRRGGEGATHE